MSVTHRSEPQPPAPPPPGRDLRRPSPTWANLFSHLGQSYSGHRLMPTLAKPTLAILIGRLWPNRLWPSLLKPTLAKPTLAKFGVSVFWPSFSKTRTEQQKKGVGPRRVGPEGWGAKGGVPKGGRPKFRAFFPLPPSFRSFLCLSGCLLVEFWWCFLKRQGLTCARLEFSGCRVKPPAAPKPGVAVPWRVVRRRGVPASCGLAQGCPGIRTNNNHNNHNQNNTNTARSGVEAKARISVAPKGADRERSRRVGPKGSGPLSPRLGFGCGGFGVQV